MPTNVIEVQHVRKEYGVLTAVNDVSFAVAPGAVWGLIGPNGAGKTTLLKMLATLLEPTEGEIRVLGFDAVREAVAIRERIGYLPDFFGLNEDLTITECLTFFAQAYHVPAAAIPARLESVLADVDLQAKRHDYIQHLSRGMVQRLGLGVLLVHEPDLLLLDEPASGLDPKARIDLRNVLLRLSREGKTVLVSSHILMELADFCSHVIIMNQGRFLTHGTIADIIAHVGGARRVKITLLDKLREAEQVINAFPASQVVQRAGQTLSVRMPNDLETLAQLNATLVGQGFKVAAFYEEQTNLEDVFLQIAAPASN